VNILKLIIYPGFKKSIVEFGFVKDINIENENIYILLDIPSASQTIEEQLKNDITTRVLLKGKFKTHVDIKKPAMPKITSACKRVANGTVLVSVLECNGSESVLIVI